MGEAFENLRILLFDGGDFHAENALFAALAIVVVAGSLWASSKRSTLNRSAKGYVYIPAACISLYFVMEMSHGLMWPMTQRFPFLFALMLVPLLRVGDGKRGAWVTALASVVAFLSIVNTSIHILRFNRSIGVSRAQVTVLESPFSNARASAN